VGRTRRTLAIDDDVLAVVVQRYRLTTTTTTEAVDLALRRLDGRPMTREDGVPEPVHTVDRSAPTDLYAAST
jgi:Arc/MetJ family transcription regulator